MWKCPNCDAQLDDEWKFCWSCGLKRGNGRASKRLSRKELKQIVELAEAREKVAEMRRRLQEAREVGGDPEKIAKKARDRETSLRSEMDKVIRQINGQEDVILTPQKVKELNEEKVSLQKMLAENKKYLALLTRMTARQLGVSENEQTVQTFPWRLEELLQTELDLWTRKQDKMEKRFKTAEQVYKEYVQSGKRGEVKAGDSAIHLDNLNNAVNEERKSNNNPREKMNPNGFGERELEMNKKVVAREWLYFIGGMFIGFLCMPILLMVIYPNFSPLVFWVTLLSFGRGAWLGWLDVLLPYGAFQVIRSILWALKMMRE
jgi:hypothetical protein